MKNVQKHRFAWKVAVVVPAGALILVAAANIDGGSAKAAMPNSVENALIQDSRLTNVSPNPRGSIIYRGNQMWGQTLWNQAGPSSETGFKHIIKSAQSSRLSTLNLRAYYKAATPAQARNNARNASYSLRWNLSEPRDCAFATPPANGQRIRLRVNRGTAGGGVVWNVVANRNSPSNQSSGVCMRFNSSFDAIGTPQPVPGDDNMYYNEIEFELDRGSGPWYNGSETNHVRFQIRAVPPPTGSVRVGHVGDVDQYSYGMVENYGANNISIAGAIRFARTCDDPVANGNGRIEVYDPDAGLFGPTFVNVYRRDRGLNSESDWTRLRKGQYTAGTERPNVVWTGARGWRIDIAGTGNSANIVLDNFDINYQYMMVLDNPFKAATPLTPPGNVLSYRLPGDPINGEIDCVSLGSYRLRPSASVGSQTAVPEETITYRGSVRNSSEDADAGTHSWTMTRIEYAPGQTAYEDKPANSASGDACTIVAVQPYTGCGSAGSYSNDFPATVTHANGPPDPTFTIPAGTPFGTTFCFITSVADPSPATVGQWEHSVPRCVIIGKKPKIHVLGYDLNAGGDVNTSLSVVNGNQYGSWTEYGLLASAGLSGMASGKGLAGGAAGNLPLLNLSTLTFANTPSLGNFGAFTALPAIDSSGAQVFNVDTNLPNVQCPVPSAATPRRICVVRGTATITSDIAYANTYSSIHEIQQLIIIADDIVVRPGVGRIDAWLVATSTDATRGRISTCSDKSFADGMGAAGLTAGQCSQALTFNGPVAARAIYLFRTHGSDTLARMDVPAETFNLRASNFLSAYSGGGGAGNPVASTDLITELPPRF